MSEGEKEIVTNMGQETCPQVHIPMHKPLDRICRPHYMHALHHTMYVLHIPTHLTYLILNHIPT